MSWRLVLLVALAALGAVLGATVRESRWPRFGRARTSRSPVSRVLAGLEGAVQGVILAVCVFALANWW